MKLQNLLSELGLERLPERWEGFYGELMNDFDKNGCPLLKSDYYKGLNEKYGMLDGLVDVYCDSAEAIRKNEALARLLHVLAFAQRDRDRFPRSSRDSDSRRQRRGRTPSHTICSLPLQ